MNISYWSTSRLSLNATQFNGRTLTFLGGVFFLALTIPRNELFGGQKIGTAFSTKCAMVSCFDDLELLDREKSVIGSR